MSNQRTLCNVSITVNETHFDGKATLKTVGQGAPQHGEYVQSIGIYVL